MQEKLLIFGGCGFVGGNLIKKANQKGWEVHVADICLKSGFNQLNFHKVDITNKSNIKEIINNLRPDALVNLAAISDIDMAENEKELARKVNVGGAVILAEVCKGIKAKYVFLSSDAVFDGENDIYTEESKCFPVNYYGRTKEEAERKILEINPDSIIIRVSLVIGFPISGGNSLFANIEDKITQGKEIICPIDEYRTPIDVLTLSESIIELIKLNYSGIIQIGATESISRYLLVKKIVKMMCTDENLIKPQDLTKMAGRALRHKKGIISIKKAQALLKTKMLNIDESLSRAFNERF